MCEFRSQISKRRLRDAVLCTSKYRNSRVMDGLKAQMTRCNTRVLGASTASLVRPFFELANLHAAMLVNGAGIRKFWA